MNSSPYYKDTGKISSASQVSMHYRKKMFSKFIERMKPEPHHTVLDIGVTNDDKYQESNYFEKMYPYKDKITCVGTEDGGYLEKKYSGIKFVQVYPGRPLPFEDKTFDIAFSNAVIEHVGSTEMQKKFIGEMMRISKAFFITTPNRWFPVEFHTALPLLHWMPKKLYRGVISTLGETYWSREENLNLLSKPELLNLFPKDARVLLDSTKFLGIVSVNLIAYGVS